ncbi:MULTISPECIES: ABC transporter ATP-binding protein [unclassified Chelatococcus]|uniref:ABC transporter ATP-binding protein n=1 Tax=unclassified Chelatococcus TaxID=2638111 RepID=UPI001BCB3BA9|nr:MULTISPECIES: ABC transporter ATP-binding protein [unclassified Chelatococcus]MBS7699711.1 ABC transporter ATP-binding protein [Chelatococcus sp. YT9]MBX3557091.1 ABC transporter ATP-binding protein [Chelatococcus sp.]
MDEQIFLRISDLSAGYGSTQVLKGLNLAIHKGEFVALLGSSGCGKTTLLRAIAGFAQPSAGSISVAGRDVTRLPPDRRGMALVFQSYALWPHMTVAQNIGYGLKLKRLPRDEIARRVTALEDLLGLSHLGQRKPAALSGGQRQRVALGRALAIDPQILLLDEPLSNLDARIRLKVRHDISALQKRLGITAVHVTHDREEAMVMADRIVIMDGGRIAQQGTPEDVYNRPASPFVAAFMGAENVLELSGRVSGDRIDIEAGPGNAHSTLPRDGRAIGDGPLEARFRAEAAELLPAGPATPTSDHNLELTGQVEATSYPGGLWRHAVRVGRNELLIDAACRHAPGTAVRIRIPADKLFLFNARSAARPSSTRSPHDARTGRVLEASEA